MVIGIDGCPLKFVKRLKEEGKIPKIGSIFDEGVATNLESTVPPVTGPSWTSFATGKNPGKHGCFDFLMPKKRINDLKVLNSTDIKSKTYYEILEEKNKKSILINLPNSYPHLTDNITITSILSESDEYVYPKELKEEIEEVKDYRIMPDTSLRFGSNLEDYFKDIRDLEKNRFEVAKKLFKDKEWNHFFLLFSGTDWINHKVYHRLYSGELDESSSAMKLYMDLDEYIGWFKENLPDDCVLLLMADHGFTPKEGYFFLNEWLRENDFLKLESGEKDRVRHRVERELERDFKKVKLPGFFRKILKHFDFLSPIYVKLLKRLPIKVEVETRVDVENTKALCARSKEIYINDTSRFEGGTVSEEGVLALKRKIRDLLKDVKYKGRKVFDEVLDSEEIYWGPESSKGPDLLPISKRWETMGECPAPNNITETKTSGHFVKGGLFAAWGKCIKNNLGEDEFNIMDLAPTILHLMNEKVPEDMDGEVLTEIFEEGTDPMIRDIEYGGSSRKDRSEGEEGEEEVRERLKDLGYLD